MKRTKRSILLTVRFTPEQVEALRQLDPAGQPCSLAYRMVVNAISEQQKQKSSVVA